MSTNHHRFCHVFAVSPYDETHCRYQLSERLTCSPSLTHELRLPMETARLTSTLSPLSDVLQWKKKRGKKEQ